MNAEKFKAGIPALIFLLLALAIGSLGYFVFQQQTEYLKKNAQNELAAVADLKADQITRWRSERKGDAQAASHDYFFESAVAQWFQEGVPPGEQRQHILDRLSTLQKAYDYRDVDLLDDQAALRLSTAGAPPTVSLSAQALALEAMRTDKVLLSDFYVAEAEAGQPIRLAVFAPFLDENGRPHRSFVFPDRPWPVSVHLPPVLAHTQRDGGDAAGRALWE